MDAEEKNYRWQHFVFNAEQRLKAFNFFGVLSVFANGGVFAALDKKLRPSVFALIGGFVIVLSCIFWIIDARNWALIELAVPGLKEYEKRFPEHSRPFEQDNAQRRRFLSYTEAFPFCLSCSCSSASESLSMDCFNGFANFGADRSSVRRQLHGRNQ